MTNELLNAEFFMKMISNLIFLLYIYFFREKMASEVEETLKRLVGHKVSLSVYKSTFVLRIILLLIPFEIS